MLRLLTPGQVGEFVRPFCEDGRVFIHQAADAVLAASRNGEHAVITKRKAKAKSKPQPGAASPPPAEEEERIPIPPTISHFVMNLPASAIDFLGSYRGVYAGHEHLFAPHTATQLPLVHVHCFAVKASAVDDDESVPHADICARIAAALGPVPGSGSGCFRVRPGSHPDEKADGGDDDNSRGDVVVVSLHNVRDVAPAKSMYCATFRLPAAVAFAPRSA